MAEAQPTWSFVVPLYNKQDFIEATLQSILSQAGADTEVLVVDDGSRDEGPARVLALADPRVRLIQQANGGVSHARNRGIREARGTWILFLDADDLLHPQALLAYRQLLARHPETQVLAGAYIRVPSSEVPAFEFKPHRGEAESRIIENLPAEFLRVGMPFFTSTIVIRRQLLADLDPWFPEGESMGEDLDLWFRVAERTSIAYTQAETALYRTDLHTSLTGSYREAELLPAWGRMRARALQNRLSPCLRVSSLRLVAEMEVTVARKLMKAGQWSLAKLHLVSAWRGMGGRRWWLSSLVWCSGSRRLAQKLR
jgi:cellulose synthase/poly-beta-1,6-N-acetylglucosamine synthase-like glycosyltransferase